MKEDSSMGISVVFLVFFMACFTSADMTALKVHIEYLDDDIFTPRTRCIIREAVEHASTLLSLSNDPKIDKFLVPREKSACAFLYYDEPNAGKCGQLSQGYTGVEWCAGARIPAAHLEGLQVFAHKETEPQPESLPEGFGFTDGTNFVLYLTARESQLCASSLAHSRVCRRETAMVGGVTSGRPVAGVLNACWKGDTDEIIIRRVIYHELMHLFGMNYMSMREFVECEGRRKRRMCFKLKDTVRVEDDQVVVWSRYFRRVIRQQVCEGIGHRQLYNDSCGWSHEDSCVLRAGMAVENVTRSVDLYGGVILAKSRTGVHWPPELFASSISVMVPQVMESGCVILDLLTLALLRTSGWYLVNCSALSCINHFLNSKSYTYSLTCNVLENNDSSTHEGAAHLESEINSSKETLSVTNLNASQDHQSFSVSEDESHDKTSPCIWRNDTHTPVALQTKDHNDGEVFPDLKSDASVAFPMFALLITIQMFFCIE